MRAFLIPLLLAGCTGHRTAALEQVRSYRYTCDYFIHDASGNFQRKMRIQAIHTRGLPGDMMRWSQPGISFGTSLEGEFSPPMKQEYMEGFSYTEAEAKNFLSAEFFKGFPATPFGFLMKNTVGDVHTFDALLTDLDRLKPNEPLPFSGANTEEIQLFGQGKQTLRRLDLTWIGDTRRNGKACSVIAYRSDIGTANVTLPGFDMTASTVFWGEICVSKKDRQVEHAMLYENTLTVPPDPDAKVKDLQSIYRAVTYEKTGGDPSRRD